MNSLRTLSIFRTSFASIGRPSASCRRMASVASAWKTTSDVPLTRENFIDLLEGRTPTIRDAGFLTPEVSRKFEQELSPKLTPYKHNTGPLLTKVGVAQFEYQAQAAEDFTNRGAEKDEYFAEAERWRGLHKDLEAKTGVNAWEKVISKISSLFPDWNISVATEGPERKYFSGVFRALNDATHVHCDWSPYDSLTEDWVINKVKHQVVFNLYLAPVKGGRTTVHDVQWSEDALKLRDPESYGYHRDITNGRQHATVVPRPGDLCFFNSRNMHEVEAVEKEPMPDLGLDIRPRLTLSSFLGYIPPEDINSKPRLILWS